MDELDPEALLLRQIRRRRIQLAVGLTIIACVAMYPCCNVVWSCGGEMVESEQRRAEHDHEATPEQRAALEQALVAFEAELPARNAEFVDSVRQIADLEPRPDLGACPIRMPVRAISSSSSGSFDQYDLGVIAMPGRQLFPWAVEPVGADAPRVAAARERITDLRDAIDRHDSLENLAAVVDAATALSRTFWTWDVVVVPGTWEMPTADAMGTTFDGGYVEGTAYLHDYASHTIACAARFEATVTRDAIDYQGSLVAPTASLGMILRSEMDAEIERAIARAMTYRAGPMLPPPTSEDDGAPM